MVVGGHVCVAEEDGGSWLVMRLVLEGVGPVLVGLVEKFETKRVFLQVSPLSFSDFPRFRCFLL